MTTSTTTRVVKLKRVKNKIVQDCDVYIGRACYMGGWSLPASKWQNPFKLTDFNNDRNLVLKMYRSYVLESPTLMKDLHELRGKTLGCWCHDKVYDHRDKSYFCHGDVLMELCEKFIE